MFDVSQRAFSAVLTILPVLTILAVLVAGTTTAQERDLPTALPPQGVFSQDETFPAYEPLPADAPAGEIQLDPPGAMTPWEEADTDVVVQLPKTGPRRDTPLQWVGGTVTWLPGSGAEELGVTSIEPKVVFALPFFTTESPLILTPQFGAHFLNGPETTDVPAAVYDSFLEIRHIRPLTPSFLLDLQLTPGWYSDFETSDSEAFRTAARALGVYTWSTSSQFVFGALYTDRFDISWLPVGGMIWTPDPDTRFEVIFPKPKLGRRFALDGEAAWWYFIAGEFGGGVWAIERAGGAHDQLAYRDFRVTVGVERRIGDYITTARLEIGYAFNRELEYDNIRGDIPVDDAFLLRGVLGY